MAKPEIISGFAGHTTMLTITDSCSLPIVVRAVEYISDDDLEPETFGKPIGVSYHAGPVECHVADSTRYFEIDVFIGETSIHLDTIEAALPFILALLGDPRIQEARVQKAREKSARKP